MEIHTYKIFIFYLCRGYIIIKYDKLYILTFSEKIKFKISIFTSYIIF